MLMKLLTTLLTGGIGKVADTYRDIKIAKVKESTQINNVVKELELKRLENEQAAHEAAKEVRIATKDYWEIRFAVGLVAIPTSFHYACIVIDSIYNMGWNIQKLPTPLDDLQGTIILSYFGLVSVRHGINVVAASMLKRK